MKKSVSGFTIVELLIVIVVIAILATITIVAYNGVQERTRDSIRKEDLGSLAKAWQLYAIDNGDYGDANCGYIGGSITSGGWLPNDYDATGPRIPMDDCLKNGGYLSKALRDPSGLTGCGTNTDCHAYLKYTCTDGSTWLFANLESKTASNETDIVPCAPTYDTVYGIDYVLRVN